MTSVTETSQTRRAELALREAIADGSLGAGERLSELTLTERFGVSRTPLRTALVRLASEGVIEAAPNGGYLVRAFSAEDLIDAVDLRGVLEGHAARRAAERGASARDLGAIEALLVAIDDLLVAETLGEEAFAAYVDLNARFHAALIGLAGNPTLAREIERVQALPFAGPSAFVGVQARLPRARSILIEAQSHHRAVVEAIRDREGGRADALMREHARLARRNLQAALTDRERLDGLPGVALIRDAGKRRA
jgi:GntR family transcriptional regulator of vanillate catabolism